MGFSGSAALILGALPGGVQVAHNHQAWCQLREMGRLRFVLFYGVLGWGLPFGLLFPAFFAVLLRLVDGEGPSYAEFVPWMLPMGLFSGAGVGWWIWVLGEQGHKGWVEQAADQERTG